LRASLTFFFTLFPSISHQMTVFGWLVNLVFYLATAPYLLSLSADYPTHVNWAIAVGLFVYMYSDASDGKQAVRTGSSSHFGELLDHSIDAAVMSFQILCFVGVVRGGLAWGLWLGVLNNVLFYSFHWREQFEENLQLGMFNGPTEALCLSIGLNVWTAFVGSAWWLQTVSIGGSLYTYGTVWLLVTVVASVATIAQNFAIGFRKGTVLNVSHHDMFLPAAPVVFLTLLAALWAYADWDWFTQCGQQQQNNTESDPATATAAAGGAEKEEACGARVHIWVLAVNAYFAYLSVNCMVERMCKMRSHFWHWALAPFLLGTLNAVLLGDALVARDGMNGFVLATGFSVLLFYGWCIARSFCALLGISFWTIPYPNKGTTS
jgi:phosphatidylglycerophosphate synthase